MRRVLVLAALLGLPRVCAAQVPSLPEGKEVVSKGAIPDTDWVLEVPPENPTTVPGDSPSSPEQIRFWDKLQAKAFDDICKNIKLPLKQDLGLGDFGGVTVEVERSLQRYPNKTLAMIDHARINVSLGYSHKVFDAAKDMPVSVSVNARADGNAYVIRPLGSTKACGEIKKLLNVLDFKTVIPVTPERIGKMAVGEIWKLPLVLSAGGGVGTSVPVNPMVSIGLSFGGSQSESASVTLMRLSPQAVRLRLRIDKANVFTGGGNVAVSFPIAEYLGLQDAGNIVEKQVNRQVVRQIDRYLRTALGLSFWKQDGRKVLLEFILDPNDPAQSQGLADFLKGNLDVLSILMRIASAAKDPLIREGASEEYLAELEEKYIDKLGAGSNFTGADDYQRNGRNFNFQLPLIWQHESGKSRDADRIVGQDKDVALHMDQATHRASNAFLDIPFLGQIVKKDSQETVQTFLQVDQNGFPNAPMMSYIQQEGFLRNSEDTARGMVGRVNDILRLVGTRGEGENPRATIPAEALVPQRNLPPVQTSFDETPQAPASPVYRSAVSAFTMVFNETALRDVLWAQPQTVVKAYVNALNPSDRALMQRVIAKGEIKDDGKIVYDPDKLGLSRDELYGDSERQGVVPTITDLSLRATALVQDLLKARDGDWAHRTQSLVRMTSGKGKSDLRYDDLMKVFVQLTDAENLFGEFFYSTDKKLKDEKDVSARYILNKQNSNKLLQESVQLKERFSEPSLLSD